MRSLVVADLHYSLPQFDWLVSAAPHFDLVIFAGDALDVGSMVDFRAQIVVVQKYLSILRGLTRVVLCSGNHDLDERSAEGEKVSRWIRDARQLGIACDGESFTMNDTLFTVCPWWDGPIVQKSIVEQAFGRGAGPVATMGLDSSRAAGELADELGRLQILRRRRARQLDRSLQTGHRGLRPCPPIAVRAQRLMVRSAW